MIFIERCSFMKIALLFFVWVFLSSLSAEEKQIVVVIPSYNNADWYLRNLESVFAQDYSRYRVIYIDDHSSDGTGALVAQFVQDAGMSHRFHLLKNQTRRGALFNTYYAITLCAPDEIVAILDGDDWFARSDALKIINAAYQDPDVWMTYGQFCYYPQGSRGWAREIPKEVIEANAIRQYDWVTTHLKTFYAGLFQKIRVQDFLYNGQFFTTAGDLAYTWPIVEMAGVHARFIPEVIYVYNTDTPLSDHKTNGNLQLYFTYLLRRQTPYQPLPSFEIEKRIGSL